MKSLNAVFFTSTAALTLGVLSLGVAPAAQAVSTYDASASFTVTLTGVTDAAGATVTSGWEVSALGFGSADLFDIGDATAGGSVSLVDPAVFLGISDSITQSSTSTGTATNGFAATDALTDLEIDFYNFSGVPLTFSFDYEVTLDAMTSGTALANASVDMLDDIGIVDILLIADSANGNQTGDIGVFPGSFEFTLGNGESNLVAGFVDTFGEAEDVGVIPVPAAVWLFGSGLIGLIGVARRKQA